MSKKSTTLAELLAQRVRGDLGVWRLGTDHPGLVGDGGERAVRRLVKELLPRRFEALCGSVVREGDDGALLRSERQFDLMIVDTMNYPVFLRDGDLALVPAKAVRMVIEVKSLLQDCTLPTLEFHKPPKAPEGWWRFVSNAGGTNLWSALSDSMSLVPDPLEPSVPRAIWVTTHSNEGAVEDEDVGASLAKWLKKLDELPAFVQKRLAAASGHAETPLKQAGMSDEDSDRLRGVLSPAWMQPGSLPSLIAYGTGAVAELEPSANPGFVSYSVTSAKKGDANERLTFGMAALLRIVWRQVMADSTSTSGTASAGTVDLKPIAAMLEPRQSSDAVSTVSRASVEIKPWPADLLSSEPAGGDRGGSN